MNDNLHRYILDHIDPEPDHLAVLDRHTHLRLLYPRMCSGHLQGRVLKMLVRMINPLKVLELGTYSSYSTQCLAEGLLHPDAVVHTIEIDDEIEDFIREHLAQSPVRDRICLHMGDARQVLPTIEGLFDLVLIDANKRQYCDYYELVLPYVRPGGFILADNTLWNGKVSEPEGHHDPQTQGIIQFNEQVACDSRVEKVILPLRDGLTIIRKR